MDCKKYLHRQFSKGKMVPLAVCFYLFTLFKSLPFIYAEWKKLPAHGRKSFPCILADLFMYSRYICNNPQRYRAKLVFSEYCKERIFKKGNKVCDYINQDEWTYWDNWNAWLHAEAAALLNDKVVTGSVFRRHGIETTWQLGYLYAEGEQLRWKAADNLSPENLRSALEKYTSIFLKPADGLRGDGCHILSLRDDILKLDDTPCSFDDLPRLLKCGGKLLAERYLCQCREMAALAPHSLNTMRMITLCDEEGNVRYLRGFLRLGTGSAPVDNWYAGGLAVKLNNDGTLGAKGIYLDATKPDEERHPDTGVVFDGYRIPMFEQAVALVCRAHRVCPELPMVGWDIAMTETGPVMVEGNVKCGVVQGVTGGFRRTLNECLLARSKRARQACLARAGFVLP